MASMLLITFVLGVAAPAAGQGDTDQAVLEDCRERFVAVTVEAEDAQRAVRASVPSKYQLSTNTRGQPQVFVSSIYCERYTAGGTTAPTTAAWYGVRIQSPDGTGCASGWPVVGNIKGDAAPLCNFYLLSAAYDNEAVVGWIRDGDPFARVRYVEDLEFVQEPLNPGAGGSPFRFRAGPPALSPYEIEATVNERPFEVPFTASFWTTTPWGETIRYRFDTAGLAFGQADGTVRPAPGSHLAKLLGTDEGTPTPPSSLLAGNHWRTGVVTREHIPG